MYRAVARTLASIVRGEPFWAYVRKGGGGEVVLGIFRRGFKIPCPLDSNTHGATDAGEGARVRTVNPNPYLLQ